ncbi:MAG TPA: endopeptidase La [Acidobacteriota bacterium]|nr:endopeptidase La [Acidobacteriota bacterium]
MATQPTGEYQTLALLPLRDVVIFPGMMMPFVVGRSRSVNALERAMETGKRLFLSAQKDAETEDPGTGDIYSLGTVSTIVQSLKRPDGTVKVLVEGVRRALVIEPTDETSFLEVVVKPIEDTDADELLSRKTRRLVRLFEKYVKLSSNLPNEAVLAAVKKDHPGRLADTIAAHLPLDVPAKQEILEIVDVEARLDRLTQYISTEMEKVKMDREIQGRVKKQMEQAQREYYLNEKIKAIQKELGRGDRESELDQLRRRIVEARLPAEVNEKVEQELDRLEAMPPMSAEATVSRNYVDWLVSVPWFRRNLENRDLERAGQVLEEDHYGLDDIKERILEFLAVRQLVDNPRGSILCFVGPPGTGKSSLAKSIARATARDFVRQSLGGVRDEAEIRGHRRTYIGAFPGQIMQRMKQAGVVNPVFLLDEIDKMSMDFRGDPSAALMEVLDPEQNHTFVDHYLDAEYDLSGVMFICTANVLHTVPGPLQDRMEVIHLSGYTQHEKVQIGRRHLLSKQIAFHGLLPGQLELSDASLEKLIDEYTREAGVRRLERELAKVCRKGAHDLVKLHHAEIALAAEEDARSLSEVPTPELDDATASPLVIPADGNGADVAAAEDDGDTDGVGDDTEVAIPETVEAADDTAPDDAPEPGDLPELTADDIFVEARDPLAKSLPVRSRMAEAIPEDATILVDEDRLEEYLGVPRYKRKRREEQAAVGLACGLAWTERGGEKLDIEVSLMPGKGKLALTGQLGDVMQESGQTALSFIRSRTAHLGVARDFYTRLDVHVHVPEGAIPKDGPSAGITLATAMVSALTGIPVRHELAMTGEVTLRGNVLPIGGVKEKVLAAHRVDITTVLLPAENEKDLKDVPEEIREQLTIHLVSNMDEVLKHALVSPLTPLPNEEQDSGLAADPRASEALEPPLTH